MTDNPSASPDDSVVPLQPLAKTHSSLNSPIVIVVWHKWPHVKLFMTAANNSPSSDIGGLLRFGAEGWLGALSNISIANSASAVRLPVCLLLTQRLKSRFLPNLPPDGTFCHLENIFPAHPLESRRRPGHIELFCGRLGHAPILPLRLCTQGCCWTTFQWYNLPCCAFIAL